MTVARHRDLCVGGATVPLPCFFPAISSVKTNLRPADYIELLTASGHPLYLVSAYDIAHTSPGDQARIGTALRRSKEGGATILLDSGNYEAYWKEDGTWNAERFHAVARAYDNDLCLCYDNQQPDGAAPAIADDVVASVLRDQPHVLGTVVPIVHGHADLLPAAARRVAEELCPVVLAVPERALGDGIVARARSVRRIRKALDGLGFYCPLHLLGTGNPASIIAYSVAGADSFDGLEWCQTVVNHRTGTLFHFQHWDFFRAQTEWGSNGRLPYIQSVLMHNLTFYHGFMRELQSAFAGDSTHDVLDKYLPSECAMTLIGAIEGED